MKKVIMLASVMFGNWVIALDTYMQLDGGVSVIKIKADYFSQSAVYDTKFEYNNEPVNFFTLGLDIGIKSPKRFTFMRHDTTMGCGVKIGASNTNAQARGEIKYKDIDKPSGYGILNDIDTFNINPYVSIIFDNCHKTFQVGIAGGINYFYRLSQRLLAVVDDFEHAYTGIGLNARGSHSIAGTIRAFFEKPWEDDYFIKFSYEYTRGIHAYNRSIKIEKASVTSPDYLHDLHLLNGSTLLLMLETPKIKFQIHTLSVSIGMNI